MDLHHCYRSTNISIYMSINLSVNQSICKLMYPLMNQNESICILNTCIGVCWRAGNRWGGDRRRDTASLPDVQNVIFKF